MAATRHWLGLLGPAHSKYCRLEWRAIWLRPSLSGEATLKSRRVRTSCGAVLGWWIGFGIIEFLRSRPKGRLSGATFDCCLHKRILHRQQRRVKCTGTNHWLRNMNVFEIAIALAVLEDVISHISKHKQILYSGSRVEWVLLLFCQSNCFHLGYKIYISTTAYVAQFEAEVSKNLAWSSVSKVTTILSTLPGNSFLFAPCA